MNNIRIKGRQVYQNQQLLGEIRGVRFPENYRRTMKKNSDFKFVSVEGESLDLSQFAYFADACKWLRENL